MFSIPLTVLFDQSSDGRNLTCANNCLGVDPNAVVLGGSAVLAGTAVAAQAWLSAAGGLAAIAAGGAMGAAGGMAARQCPATRQCQVGKLGSGNFSLDIFRFQYRGELGVARWSEQPGEELDVPRPEKCEGGDADNLYIMFNNLVDLLTFCRITNAITVIDNCSCQIFKVMSKGQNMLYIRFGICLNVKTSRCT